MNATRSDSPSGTSLTRIVGSSMIGTTVEWYDFFLYGSAAALVFNTAFFPTEDKLIGTLLAFSSFAIGFVFRPLGGLVFGHFGDRLGRKKLLVLSLLLMGGATFAVGLLPTFGAIGVAAPILLTLLRVVQGFALGGEWGGAVLIVSEHTDSARRGFWASWPQAGVPTGNLLATAVLAVLSAVQSDEAFMAWGWRVPFLLSGLLVLVGLWIRLSVSESPVFLDAADKAQQRSTPEQPPIVRVLREQWREVLIASGARFVENVCYYVITAFVLTYITEQLGLSESIALNAVLVASVVHFVVIPIWGALSDRYGRRGIYLIGAVGTGFWIFAFFPLLGTGSFTLIALGVTGGLILHAAMYGPQAAFMSELFGTRVRYSGASIGYQLASVIAGGLAPTIATGLLAAFDSWVPIAVYVALGAAVTSVAILFATETRGSSLHTESTAETEIAR
ncbi:metabolite-proton symporter [Actinopolyspora lacussalsi]|uniref:Putative proline/betaine transporter n=1 Tax=Actinopolyspora righensis TaxID=995060 RepID=A0A1I7BJ86_9ACTN|nr:MFS transporter [Actinopolyspora righensis]MDP9640777.1 metabolite-proton symporter [Actinopolyspora lacussalsi]SFT87248.1 metabolite-proton symporter [Actinopolyspora righensis]